MKLDPYCQQQKDSIRSKDVSSVHITHLISQLRHASMSNISKTAQDSAILTTAESQKVAYDLLMGAIVLKDPTSSFQGHTMIARLIRASTTATAISTPMPNFIRMVEGIGPLWGKFIRKIPMSTQQKLGSKQAHRVIHQPYPQSCVGWCLAERLVEF